VVVQHTGTLEQPTPGTQTPIVQGLGALVHLVSSGAWTQNELDGSLAMAQ
jgi:hypothetical protein